MGKPITATSANISGLPPARSEQEVIEMFGNEIDYIVDGGQTPAGLCSTILSVQNGRLNIVRHGQIDLSEELGEGTV
jgi:L-threonylcarbamoyladenylate synthase